MYGLGSGHAAETQLLLSMKGYNAYSLHEGFSEWWDLIITPTSLRSETQSPSGYQQAKQLREYFMGTTAPQGAATAAPALPQLPPAAAPGSTATRAEKTQAWEGMLVNDDQDGCLLRTCTPSPARHLSSALPRMPLRTDR